MVPVLHVVVKLHAPICCRIGTCFVISCVCMLGGSSIEKVVKLCIKTTPARGFNVRVPTAAVRHVRSTLRITVSITTSCTLIPHCLYSLHYSILSIACSWCPTKSAGKYLWLDIHCTSRYQVLGVVLRVLVRVWEFKTKGMGVLELPERYRKWIPWFYR